MFGVFFDYTSLYQWERSPQEERSYRKAMDAVYIIYAHEASYTLCINELTPHVMRLDPKRCGDVMAYDKEDGMPGKVKRVKIEHLDMSKGETGYVNRGWCISELQWSGLRETNVVPEFEEMNHEGQRLWKHLAPLPHDLLRKKLSTQEVKFTWREDMEIVIKSQELAFSSKVKQSDTLHLEELDSEQLDFLGDAVHHYKKMKTLEICNSSIGQAEESVGEAEQSAGGVSQSKCNAMPALTLVSFIRRLNSNHSLRKVILQKCKIGDREVEVLLTEAIDLGNNTWQILNLHDNEIQNSGAVAFAKSISSGKCRLEELILSKNEIQDAGALELARAWKESVLRSKSWKSKKWRQRLRRLDLSENEIHFPEKIPIPPGVKDGLKLNDQKHCL